MRSKGMEVGGIGGGIIVPLRAVRRPGIREGRLARLRGPRVGLPVAVLAELAKVWERLQQEGLWNAVLFYRASEVQELYFCFFILFYLMVFRQRVLARRVAGLPARPAAGP